ncbi:TapB family protein [Ulvibacterium marinum]|uniref:DUF3108 domain-containing protein n=1 Tax=Ulvibacterium marinum TaxID=2419782 RepID=A0A3B0CC77_9FLAO|nr:hypothetical protein [Ulvibacterium marinum]RKN83593.1 hypothetical protein D7Z94_07200 [Ulvibacterium marinum]
MKKTILGLTLALLFGTHSLLSQDNCSKYYPLEEGTTFQYTMYNKKGKTEGITDYRVTNVDNSGGETSATMAMKFTDKKGKEAFTSDYKYTCTGKGIKIDFNSLLPEAMTSQFKDMEYEITGTDIELPNDLSVGQTLDDANVTMAISMAGVNMNIEVNMINRKVEKRESVTTPAGTFDCYVLYNDTQSKTMGANQTFPSRLWLAEGVGMIKQETYKKDGALMNSMALTQFSK